MPWKILILEDSATSAALIVTQLEQAGIDFECSRATTRAEFMDRIEALTVTRERSRDLPFIFVTGTLTESAARVLLRHGATDFIQKAELDRLGHAVKNALRGRVAARRTDP